MTGCDFEGDREPPFGAEKRCDSLVASDAQIWAIGRHLPCGGRSGYQRVCRIRAESIAGQCGRRTERQAAVLEAA
jgi:hypothetical protein